MQMQKKSGFVGSQICGIGKNITEKKNAKTPM